MKALNKLLAPSIFLFSLFVIINVLPLSTVKMPENFEFMQNQLDGGIVKFTILDSESRLQMTYDDFINYLIGENGEFRHELTLTLQSLPVDAYFWECINVSNKNLNKLFEFVIVPATELSGIRADISAFENLMSSCGDRKALAFPNLGRDAILVAPCPSTTLTHDFAHLANFLRTADDHSIDIFWKVVGQTLQQVLSTRDDAKKLWLSTSGLGVPWLHVRLDDRPKYYNFLEYKL